MATVSEIVVQAFREGNFTAVGEEPTPEEIAEAIPRLRLLIDKLFGFEIGEAYRDWYVPSDFTIIAPLRSPYSPTGDISVASGESWKYPPSNVRLLVKTTEARTVVLPANPADGARLQFLNIASSAVNITLNGNGHLIENAASLVDTVTNLHTRKWFYRADLGDWIRLESIVDENSTTPLPAEFDDMLVCGLAMRLQPRFGTPIDQTTVACYVDMLKRLKKRYRQSEEMPASFGELRSTSTSPVSAFDA